MILQTEACGASNNCNREKRNLIKSFLVAVKLKLQVRPKCTYSHHWWVEKDILIILQTKACGPSNSCNWGRKNIIKYFLVAVQL